LIADDSPVDRQLIEGLLAKDSSFEISAAENGRAALDFVRQCGADIVVTDMQMPELDGLGLVRALRRECPDVPTILITAFGSEELAHEALLAGAANYVPKSKAAALLLPALRSVRAMLVAERNYADLLARSTEARFKFALDNDPKYFCPIGDLCSRMLAGLSPLPLVERLRVAVAIEHALKNALYRGNLEIGAAISFPDGDAPLPSELSAVVEVQRTRFAKRTIQVDLAINQSELTCRITNEGSGFQPSQDAAVDGPGRGLTLMRSFMDQVAFSDRGRTVELVRRWGSAAGSAAARPAAAAAGAAGDSDLDDLLNIGDATPAPLGTLHGGDPPLTYEIHHADVLIGRARTCHIVLPHPGIADHHCRLIKAGGLWSFQAVSPQAVVIHNGVAARGGRLESGDSLGIGRVEFTVMLRG
jgi:CheY-like chemotaxis protein